MPFDYDAWGDEDEQDQSVDLSGGLLGTTEAEPEERNTELAYKQRGTLGDILSLAGRAGVSTLETLENAAEFFDWNDSTIDTASKLRQFDIFKPDIDEYYDKGWLGEVEVLGKSIGSIPSAAESMGPSLAVAGAGFLAGQIAMPFLPVAGGIVGATLASLGIMGTAEYQQTYEVAKSKGLSEDDAKSLAWKTGAIEGLGESAGSLIGMAPLLKPLTNIAKTGLKPTLKTLLKADAKSMAKELFKVYAGEQVTEFGQAAGQTYFMKNAGITDQSMLEASLQTIIPTMFMTGGFQLGTNTIKAKQRAKLKKALSKESDLDIRLLAAGTVSKLIQQEDADIAEKWNTFAIEKIKNNQDISWNEDFGKFADDLELAHSKPGEPFTDEDIINGTVTESQINAHLNQSRKSDIFSVFEDSLLGMNKKVEVTIPEAEDRAGINEKADEILEEARKEIEEKPVPQEVMDEARKEEALEELKEIDKVLENPNISPEVRFQLGERAMSLRNAMSLREAEVLEEGETAERDEPEAEVEPIEPVAPEETEVAEDVATEIKNRQDEVDFLQNALKQGVSPEARTVLENRLNIAQNELQRLQAPAEAAPPAPVRDLDSSLGTKEQVEQVLGKLGEALSVATKAGDQDQVERLQDAIDKYTTLQNDLPSAEELSPEALAIVEEDFKRTLGEDIEPEQVLEAEEGQGAFKITEAAESPIFTSERKVDLPGRIINWSQDLETTTGVRTSNLLVGKPRGSDIEYWLLRDLEDKGTWLLMKKEPGNKAIPLHTFDVTEAKLQGLDARRQAAEFAENHFRALGSKEWLPDQDADGRNTWSIKVPGGTTRLVLTQLGKNKWSVEEDTNTVQRELDSGRFSDVWASLSIGQVKEAIEDLYGFSTSDTAKEILTEEIIKTHVESPKTFPKPKAMSTRDYYTIYEPVLTPEQSAQTRRKHIGPGSTRRTMDYNYNGLEMTDEIRDRIEADIAQLNDELGATQASIGFKVADATGETKTVVSGIEDNISALTRISLIKNGEKIRIKTGVNQAGRTIYARVPRIKPRKEIEAPQKITKAATTKAVKEVGGQEVSKAQEKRDRAKLEETAGQYTKVPEPTLTELEEQAEFKTPEEFEGRETPDARGIGTPAEAPQIGQPVAMQPDQATREAEGIGPEEIVRPDVAPFEFTSAKEDRQELLKNAKEEYVTKRDHFVNIMLDRVEQGKGRPLTDDEALYYSAVNIDIYQKNNPFQPVGVLPDVTPEEIQKAEADIRVVPVSPRAEARKRMTKRQRIIQKQNRLRMPSYVKDYGTPLETNAWQLLESTQDEPLVKAFMQILSKEELEKIEVIHDPLETTSYYSVEGDYIVLKGDNPFTKVHEVLHAALFYRLRRSPGLTKEAEGLMEKFRKKAVEMGVQDYPTVAYAMKNIQEFLSQAGADPVVQMVLEASPTSGKFRNLWESFVDWARKVIGLPQRFRREMGEALNLITKISQRQRIARTKFLGERNITLAAGPEVKETPEQRRKRIRDVQQKAREANVSQGWVGDTYKGIADWAKQIFKYTGTFVQPINDALHNIQPKFAALMRINEARLSKRNKEQMTRLSTLAEAIKDFSDDELSDFKSGWINPDERELLEELVKKKGIEKEWKYFTDIVKQNERNFLNLGILSRRQLKENYLPRVVKDPLGLINKMEGTPEGTAFSQQIRQERIRIEKQGGAGAFDKAHQEEFIAKLVLNRRYNALPRKGFTKQRIFDHVPAHLMEYYHDPIESIIDYVHHANELLFQRELVGVSGRNKQLEELARLEDRLEKAKGDKREVILAQVQEIANNIQDIDTDTRAAVDKLLINMEGIDDQQRKEVADMINARLNQKGTRGAVRSLKNVSLMMTIGNPLSAITQLGDQGFNIMDNGVNGISGIAKALTGGGLVANFDIENVLREFSKEGGSSDILNKLMGWSGLKRMDTFGKESYMQGLMSGIQGGSFENFQQKYDIYAEFLDGEQDPELRLREAFASIKEGKPNENALYMMFSELAKRQPVSLSETSQQFLTAGNARIFWVLKQFALRSMSSAVQDMRNGFAEGNGTKGIMRAVGLIGLLGLMGAGTDALKDIILGRNLESLPDSVINNIMNLMFLNRYTLERGLDQKKPISSLIANNLMLPPARAVDDLVTDVWKSAQGDFSYRTMAHVPMFGRIAFDYTPMGREAEGKRMRAEILSLAEKGASQGRLGGLIKAYNQGHADAQVEGLEPITVESIKMARKPK